MTPPASLAARVRAAWQLVRELAGERDYENYLAHHAEHHPGETALGERAFWRARSDRQERNAAHRCC